MSECKWNFEFYENSVKLSSVKLSKKPSSYFQLYQLLFEQLFGKFMSVTIIYVCYSWQDLFLKCNRWKWKIEVEIKVKEEYTKGTTIFVFTIFITYIDDLKI